MSKEQKIKREAFSVFFFLYLSVCAFCFVCLFVLFFVLYMEFHWMQEAQNKDLATALQMHTYEVMVTVKN